MTQKDFNRMLNDYLGERVKPSKTKRKVSFKRQKPKEDKEVLSSLSSSKVHVLPEDETMVDRMFQRIANYLKSDPDEKADAREAAEDEFIEEEKEYTQEIRPTMWERLKAFFTFDSGEPERFVEAEEDLKEEAEEILEKEEEIREEEAELEEQKEHFLKRFMNAIGFGKRVEDDESEFETETQEENDLKDLAKITTKTMKLMEKRHFEEFKETEDFQTFKDILERNNLIKK